MKILVAGGAGFLGSHLVEALVKRGDTVTVIDDLSSGVEENLSEVINSIRFIKSDISCYSTHEKYEAVVNMASRASRREWETYPVEVALANSIGNNSLVKIALNSNAKYIFASTSEIYGNPEKVPTPETYLGRVSTTGTRSPYDEGKRFGEALIKAYEREYGLRNVIIRFFNTYGPRMRGGDLYGRVLDRFIQQAISNNPITVYGTGNQTRSFSFVSDIVVAVIKIIDEGKEGLVYNIGNDIETRIIDLANIVIKTTNSASTINFEELPPDDPERRGADITEIKKLGWRPTTSLSDGISKMVKYYRTREP